MTNLRPLLEAPNFRLSRGRCLVELERKPERKGSIIVPERLRDQTERDPVAFGRVLRVTHRRPEDRMRDGSVPQCGDFEQGDRVLVLLTGEDLEEELIITDTTRVIAQVTE